MAAPRQTARHRAPRARRAAGDAPGRGRQLIWAGTVGLVLADSSVVTLALPEMLRRFDTTVLGVSWVLTAFNLVLAVAVLPAARLAVVRGARGAAAVWAAGVVAFGIASLLCAIAPTIAVLIIGRCVQAVAGACVIAGAIELLARSRGSHTKAAAAWGAAGLIGIAVGPAAGGLLTELISWEAIFVLQVPVVVLVGAAVRPPAAEAEQGRAGRLRLAPELGLGLLSAGLTGALFLLVIMLTEGWGHSPLEAALIVSAMPVATIAARRLTRGLAHSTATMAAGAIALAGGLAALGLLPAAEPAWTLVPQAFIGLGIALALPGLTGRALSGADPAGHRAAGTLAARHVGIVVGLLILTPLFSSELTEQQEAAERSGTALILDAPLSPQTKIELGTAVTEQIERAGGRLPDLAPAFDAVTPPEEARADYARLEERLAEEVDKAATHAFSWAFLIAGGLALLAIAPIAMSGGAPARRGALAIVAASASAAGLAAVYLALGRRAVRAAGGGRSVRGPTGRAAARADRRRARADRPVDPRRRRLPAPGHARGARARRHHRGVAGRVRGRAPALRGGDRRGGPRRAAARRRRRRPARPALLAGGVAPAARRRGGADPGPAGRAAQQRRARACSAS